jgi:hypothetical protein
MATWVKCTDENGQTIYANLDNAITLIRDDVRHRGTVSHLWEVQTVPPVKSRQCLSLNLDVLR